MRLVNWNIERRGPLTWQAASLVSEIQDLAPDLVVLTEAHIDSMDACGGHALSHPGYNSGHRADRERLVLMWSRSPWEEIPLPDALQRHGGALLGRTHVDGRAVHCLALCVPWHMCPGVPPGEKVRPWSQHVKFLDLLKAEMDGLFRYSPLIIAGDFNRRIPRRWGPIAPYELMQETFCETDIVTQGLLAPLELETIDHVALKGPLAARSVRALDRFDHRQRPRSDHFGVMVDLDWT
jgi:endonuclease/exonuclease/phosphatase (EEP) superfamily protein YafD